MPHTSEEGVWPLSQLRSILYHFVSKNFESWYNVFVFLRAKWVGGGEENL